MAANEFLQSWKTRTGITFIAVTVAIFAAYLWMPEIWKWRLMWAQVVSFENEELLPKAARAECSALRSNEERARLLFWLTLHRIDRNEGHTSAIVNLIESSGAEALYRSLAQESLRKHLPESDRYELLGVLAELDAERGRPVDPQLKEASIQSFRRLKHQK
jgi:hypothetical protein